MKKIRLSIVEDNLLLRQGIAALVKKLPDIEVVAASENSEEALRQVRELKPDVVLVDLSLGDQDSLHLAETITKEVPEAKVVMMDLIPTQEDVLEFVKAGVSGFILKDAPLDDLLRTISLVAQGEKVLPPSISESLFSQIVEHAGRVGKKQAGESMGLTKGEREVIDLIAEGLSNEEIAQQLHATVYTVKSDVHKILEKLALRTRFEMVDMPRPKRSSRFNKIFGFLI